MKFLPTHGILCLLLPASPLRTGELSHSHYDLLLEELYVCESKTFFSLQQLRRIPPDRTFNLHLHDRLGGGADVLLQELRRPPSAPWATNARPYPQFAGHRSARYLLG